MVPSAAADDHLLAKVETQLKSSKIRLAVFSHIVSTPGIILPVEKLIRLCRKYNVLTLIDGAHAFGQLKLDLQAMGEGFLLIYCFTQT